MSKQQLHVQFSSLNILPQPIKREFFDTLHHFYQHRGIYLPKYAAFIASTNLHYTICHFIGFGIRVNPTLGLTYLHDLASEGDLAVQAIILRLYEAFGSNSDQLKTLPATGWLTNAVKSGSRIAAKDLQNHSLEMYHEAVQQSKSEFCGLGRDLFSTGLEPTSEIVCQESDRLPVVNSRGDTILHLASARYMLSDLSSLLEKPEIKLRINQINYFGETPILAAFRSGHYQHIRILMSHGADLTLSRAEPIPEDLAQDTEYISRYDDRNYESCFHYVSCFKDQEIQPILQLLVKADVNPLLLGTVRDFIPRSLSETDIDWVTFPHYLDANGGSRTTAFGRAVRHNHLHAVKMFLTEVPIWPWNIHRATPTLIEKLKDVEDRYDVTPENDLEKAVFWSCGFHNVQMLKVILPVWLQWDNLPGKQVSSKALRRLEELRSAFLECAVFPHTSFERVCLLGPGHEDRLSGTLDYLLIGSKHPLSYYVTDYCFARALDPSWVDVFERLEREPNIVHRPQLEMIPKICHYAFINGSSDAIHRFLKMPGAKVVTSTRPEMAMEYYILYDINDTEVLEVIFTMLKDHGIDHLPRSFIRALLANKFSLASRILSFSGGKELHEEIESPSIDMVFTPLGHAAFHHDDMTSARLTFLFVQQDLYGSLHVVVNQKKKETVFHALFDGDRESHTDTLFRLDEIDRRCLSALNILLGHFSTPVQLNTRADDGCTALHVAVEVGSVRGVKRLLAAGADPNIKRNAKKPLSILRTFTTLDLAVMLSDEERNLRRKEGRRISDDFRDRKLRIIEAIETHGGRKSGIMRGLVRHPLFRNHQIQS